MKVVFFGTPAWAVPALRAVLAAGHTISAVVTAPDAPVGRSRAPVAPPVKAAARDAGLGPILQPVSLRGADARAAILEHAADVFVVVAYGRILPGRLLDAPTHGAVNVHFSLLPRHRGASPVQHAIWLGDEVTGVTTMAMDRGLDTGAILHTQATPIGARETSAALGERLAGIGAGLLVETLAGLARGAITPRAQDDAHATLAPPLRPEDGHVDWAQPAEAIARAVRAFDPWPAVVCEGPKGRLRLLDVDVLAESTREHVEPGSVLRVHAERVDVVCGHGTVLALMTVQPAGSRAMSAGAALRGRYLDPSAPLRSIAAGRAES